MDSTLDVGGSSSTLDIVKMIQETIQKSAPGTVVVINIIGGNTDPVEPDNDDLLNPESSIFGGGGGGTSGTFLAMEANSPSNPISSLPDTP